MDGLPKKARLKGRLTAGVPTCPLCGVTMIKRKRRADGVEFWGCSDFPGCHGARDVDYDDEVESLAERDARRAATEREVDLASE